jgi:hypothetical protein
MVVRCPVKVGCEGIDKDILTGDFVAILSSAVCAIYNNFSGLAIAKDKDKDKDRCPLSVYLSLLAIIVIIFSILASYVSGDGISILSVDPEHGLFGFFGSRYLSLISS